jgi:hypothetical protein
VALTVRTARAIFAARLKNANDGGSLRMAAPDGSKIGLGAPLLQTLVLARSSPATCEAIGKAIRFS